MRIITVVLITIFALIMSNKKSLQQYHPINADQSYLDASNLNLHKLEDIIEKVNNNLTKLDLSYNKLSNVQKLSTFYRLTYLDLAKNYLTEIDSLENLTTLTNLRLFGNKIHNIQVLSRLKNLEYLDLSSNPINDPTLTDVPSQQNILKSLTNLKDLKMSYNQMENMAHRI